MTKYEHGPGLAEKPHVFYDAEYRANGSDDLSLADVFQFFARAKYWVLAGALALLAAAALALFAKVLTQPMPVSYSSAVVVTMNGVETGTYPNGAPYSVTDLRSAAVLEEVHRINKLQDYGINIADFSGMVSVAPYSPAYSVLVDRYRQRLSDKEITFEERKAIEAEFKQSINSLNSSGLIVTITIPQSLHIPDQLGVKIADDIPSVWADVFTKRLGVANVPILVSGSPLIDEALAARLDYPLGYDYLYQQAAFARLQIKSLSDFPGISTFISSKKKSLADISRDFEAFQTFHMNLGLKPLVDLGLSKNASFTSLIYDNRIKSLDRDAITQSEFSTKVEGILNSLGATPGTPVAGGEGVPSANLSAQIDGAFVDKIVELSQKGSGLEFATDLQKQRLAYENEAVSIADTRARLNERLTALRQTSLQGIEKQNLEKQFVGGYAVAITELNAIWSQLVDLSSEFSASRLNYDKTIFRLSSLPNDLRISRAALADTRSMMLLAIAALLGAALGAMLRFVKEQMVPSKTARV
jgi:hypothetical protein